MTNHRFLQLSDLHIGKGDNDDHMKIIVKGIIEKQEEHKTGGAPV